MAKREFIAGQREPEVPSSTLSYFVREAGRRIWISKRTSFVAIAMIAISLFILGGFVLVADNLGRAVTQSQGRSRVSVYLAPDATPEQVRAIDQLLAGSSQLSSRRLVTREEALRRFKTYFTNLSDVVDQLEENPFPPSFDINVAPSSLQSAAFQKEIAAVRAMPAVDQVQFDWEWLDRLRRLIAVVNLVGVVAGGVLALAAAFTIANVIRLTMMMYREEIEIMRLVGATERIIRGPFLLEGIMQGTIGGVLAIGLLFAVFTIARGMVAPSSSLLLGFLFVTFLGWQKIAALVAGGMVAGWFGSWLSVRERVTEEA